MMMKIFFTIYISFFCYRLSAQILAGCERTGEYFPLLQNKNVAMVVHSASVIGKKFIVDSLLENKINIVKLFAPEHGIRGDNEAGKHIENFIDKKTKLPVISLYGKHLKPTADELKDIDVVVFDLQDVGCRFYTYISTLHYIMQACAENDKKLILLDRPNPNGYYVDGPVLDTNFRSFVGMHPVPIVYGMSMGEYAQMINGEKWIGEKNCDLTVIPCYNYTHKTMYELPIAPSPNLRTKEAIYLYPSLCLFEGTDVSVGRGTDKPFEVIGKPNFKDGKIKFKPKHIKNVSENPLYMNEECNGFDLTLFCRNYITYSKKIYLYWLQGFYDKSTDTAHFFNPMFEKLAGTDELRKQIIAKKTVAEIEKSWEPSLKKFMGIRKKYIIYPDFY